MKKTDFQKRLLGLAEILGVEIKKSRVDGYWEVFKDYPDKELIRAINLSLKTNKFFPKPAELIELIEGSPADKSLQAWHISLEAIRNKSPQFEDKRIVAVISDMGGWQEFCRIADTKGLYLKEKGFREKYQYYFRQPIPSNISINIADNSLRIGYADEPVYKRA